jgi:hypothetical protein
VTAGTWRALYGSDLQALYALWVVPIAFLPFLARDLRRPAADRADAFVRGYALAFALETILDPFAGGPLVRWLGLGEGAATAVVFLFVLLGDFRVFLLIFGLDAVRTGRPARHAIAAAAGWTLVVPVATAIVHRSLAAAYGTLPGQVLWLVYELGFLALTVVFASIVLPRRIDDPALRRYLAAVVAYVAAYYALWAAADALILTTGADAAWALRMVPNQLYYALYVPFVYALWFARRYTSTRSSAHASR